LCQLPTSCQPVMGKYDTCWSGRILNISRGGVNVLMPRRFEPGTLLQIEIHFPADQDKEPHAVLARVVHANPKGPGHWSLGCAFPWAITEEDLRAMLAASESTLS